MFSPAETDFITAAPAGRLATVATDGTPHVIPVCFVLVTDDLFIPLDEKPKSVGVRDLKRVRNILDTKVVSLVIDHYSSNWSQLGWVQVTGTAALIEPTEHDQHATVVAQLRTKYPQYSTHSLEDQPVIRIQPEHVVSWGNLDPCVFS